MEDDKLITIKKASELLAVSTKYMRQNDDVFLPVRTKGNARRYRYSTIMKFINRNDNENK